MPYKKTLKDFFIITLAWLFIAALVYIVILKLKSFAH
jgi:hypothetical protein